MFLIFLVVLIFVLVRLFTSIWLQIWLDAGDGQVEERLANATAMNVTITDQELRGDIGTNPKLGMYQMIHGLSLIVLVFVGLSKGFAMAVSLLKGSSRLHERMLKRVMRCPMSFFDSTPSGRVINRFSKDMDESK
jgi:ABC-type multidrug transport system fused ATPase/permease subunit